MTIVPKRPWWKFWPVLCRRHLRFVWQEGVCPACLRDKWDNLFRGPKS